MLNSLYTKNIIVIIFYYNFSSFFLFAKFSFHFRVFFFHSFPRLLHENPAWIENEVKQRVWQRQWKREGAAVGSGDRCGGWCSGVVEGKTFELRKKISMDFVIMYDIEK